MNDELKEKLASQSSIQKIDEIPDDLKEIFVTSHDITPEWHIKNSGSLSKICR